MALTSSERQHALECLAKRYEPCWQNGEAIVLLSSLREQLRFKYFFELIEDNLLQAMQVYTNEYLRAWRETPKRIQVPFFKEVEISVVAVASLPKSHVRDSIGLYPNEAWKALHDGRAPIHLFNPSPEFLERLWAVESGEFLNR